MALAASLLRFVHGVPGVGRATVEVDTGSGSRSLGSIAFGEVTPWHSISSGRFEWKLVGRGGKLLASGSATVGNGAYDILVLEKGGKPWLGIYKARAGKPGTSLVRVIHGAPELGSPELAIDGKVAIKSLSYTQATPYVAVTPGSHSLAAMRAGDSSPLVEASHVKLAPGVAYSGIVLGTRGQKVRVIAVADRGGPVAASPAKPGSKSGRAGRSQSRTIEVTPGDSLWSIARRLVGPSASDEAVERQLVAIWNLNSVHIGTGNPNLIYPGTRLRVPR
ncbi:MAG: DUF4397 domain-containing protein [Solirubrobacteraceae bacterium]